MTTTIEADRYVFHKKKPSKTQRARSSYGHSAGVTRSVATTSGLRSSMDLEESEMPNHKLGKKKMKAPQTDYILGKKGRKIMRKMQLRNGVAPTI